MTSVKTSTVSPSARIAPAVRNGTSAAYWVLKSAQGVRPLSTANASSTGNAPSSRPYAHVIEVSVLSAGSTQIAVSAMASASVPRRRTGVSVRHAASAPRARSLRSTATSATVSAAAATSTVTPKYGVTHLAVCWSARHRTTRPIPTPWTSATSVAAARKLGDASSVRLRPWRRPAAPRRRPRAGTARSRSAPARSAARLPAGSRTPTAAGTAARRAGARAARRERRPPVRPAGPAARRSPPGSAARRRRLRCRSAAPPCPASPPRDDTTERSSGPLTASGRGGREHAQPPALVACPPA